MAQLNYDWNKWTNSDSDADDADVDFAAVKGDLENIYTQAPAGSATQTDALNLMGSISATTSPNAKNESLLANLNNDITSTDPSASSGTSSPTTIFNLVGANGQKGPEVIISGGTPQQKQTALAAAQSDYSTYSQYIGSQAQEPISINIGSEDGVGVAGAAGAAGETFEGRGTGPSQSDLDSQESGNTLLAVAGHEIDNALNSGALGNAGLSGTGQETVGNYFMAVANGFSLSDPLINTNDQAIQNAINSGTLSKATLEEAYYGGDPTAAQQAVQGLKSIGIT